MTDMQTTPNQVPPEVAKLWTELHAEALVRYETLRAQTEGVSVGRMVAIGIPVLLIVLAVVLGGLYSAGAVTIPAFVCGASEGLCTPTPTLEPTATPQPTYTPLPTPTPLPPTKTPTPTPTPTITPTPVPFDDLLGGCVVDDFAAELVQTSPVEQYKTNRTDQLSTQFTITNTGSCMLVQWFLKPDVGQNVDGDPELLNPGMATKLSYDEWSLDEGMHAVTLTLVYKSVEGKPIYLEDTEFVLNLEVILDYDGDGIPDKEDCCPRHYGVAVLRGCPDGDNDGSPDSNTNSCPSLPQTDCCPKLRGLESMRGCPDADEDGYPESNEKACPSLPATDKCPKEFGRDATCPGCTLECHTEYDQCEVEVCERDPVSGEETCRTEQQYCNPHQVCEPCP